MAHTWAFFTMLSVISFTAMEYCIEQYDKRSDDLYVLIYGLGTTGFMVLTAVLILRGLFLMW